ncbi:hypothetical protein CI109_104248 [Kwoniella shandongensis]|uniref:Uncharacterized protein n=1 Tax=Kwoniella shandongensis TaxID=1734106 RepID=A0A5M6C0M2_9TREE|nr:uncharacterized protein CI109_002846 [Kwoniella shandongensis]KAA5528688.1 hypothetical protein CI109_002846 [Kwoniella shandongensis]
MSTSEPTILITAGPYQFLASLHTTLAPSTSTLFLSLLPYTQKLIHVRWSGEGVWIPLGYDAAQYKVPYENHTSHPAPGEFILYPPGGISEAEFLLAYGGVSFSSKMGQLAGNHFLTITEGKENLRKLGEKTLWDGAQDVRFELADDAKINEFRQSQKTPAKL